MFEHFHPFDAGVLIKSHNRAKFSKHEFEDTVGKMSLETYCKKISDGNFVSAMLKDSPDK